MENATDGVLSGGAEAYKGQAFIPLRVVSRPGQHADLIIGAVLFLALLAVIEPIEHPIFQTVLPSCWICSSH